MKRILGILFLLASACAFGQISGGGSANLPTPGGSGLCFISNGSTQGAWTWGSCTGSTSAAWSALTAATNSNTGSFVSSGNSWDFSGVTIFKMRVGAGLTTTVNGDIGYDTTNKNWHVWQNGVDSYTFGGPVASSYTNNDCVKFGVASSVITLVDAGSACGSGGGTPGGSNTQIQYNNSNAFGGISGWTTNGSTNMTAGATSVLDLHAITSTSGILFPGAFATGFLQVTTSTGAVASVGSTGTGNVVLVTSPTLVTPLLGTPTSGVITNLTGTCTACNINGTVGATTPAAGTFTTLTANTSLVVNGGTAQTGTQGTDTKLLTAGTVSGTAATLCTDANGGATTSGCSGGISNPMTTLGDETYGGASGVFTRLAGPTTPNSVPEFLVDIPSAGAATAESWYLSGVPVDATSPATLLVTDRANYIKWASGTALALPAVATTFASNLPFSLQNIEGATLTITPNAGASDLIDGAASGTLLNNFAALVYQDSTTAPGHWFTIKYPTFAALGSTCANALTWSTTTGFGCSAAYLTGIAFPLTVSGTVTSGGIPYFNSTTQESSSGILNTNILVKGGGAGSAPTNSSVTDNATTVTTTDTGGYVAPVFTANGTTAGFIDFPQGTTSAAVAPCNTATSICLQSPTSVTSQLRVFAGAPASGFSLWTNSSGTMTETIAATSGTLTSGVGTWGNQAINTVLASTVANVAGHFTNLQVVTSLFNTCTSAPIFNVFDGTSNTGSTVTATGSTQTKGTGTSTAQTLTFAAGDIIGIYISTAGATCTADLYTVTAQYSVP